MKRNYPGKNHNILLHSIPKAVLKSIDDLYSFVIRWQKTKYESWQFDILSKEDKYLQKIYRYLDLGSNYAEGKQEEYYRAYDEHFFQKYCNEMLQKPIFISDKVIRKIIGDDLKYKDLLKTENKDLHFAFKYKDKASELLSEIEGITATSKPSKELYDKKNDLIASWAKDEILAYILKGGLQKYRNLDIELDTKDNDAFKYLANQKVEYSMTGSKNNRIRITDIPLKHFGKIDSYANDKRFKTIISRTYKFEEIDSYITEYEKTRKLLVSGILAFEKQVIDSGAYELDDKEGYIVLKDIINQVDSSFLDIKELRDAVFHNEYKSTEILNSNLRRVLELIRKCM